MGVLMASLVSGCGSPPSPSRAASDSSPVAAASLANSSGPPSATARAARSPGPRVSDPLVFLPNPMPDELFGVRTIEITPYGGKSGHPFPSLDVNDVFLLRGPSGEALEWAGAAVE